MSTSEASKYIESLFAVCPELGDSFNTILEYHRKRLWHQLTLCLVQLVKNPLAQQKLELLGLYHHFIATFETKLNQLTLVRLAFDISKQLSGSAKIEFLKQISELPKVIANSEAFVDSRSVLAEMHLLAGEPVQAKESLAAAKEILDQTAGAEASVYSNYHRSWAAYHKVCGEPCLFYHSALQYVAYTQIDTMPKGDLASLAFDLGVAALVGENIFNFGDLLEHPVIESLQGTEQQWLAEVIYAFNLGDITTWKKLQVSYADQLNRQSILREKHELLDEKIAVMSLIEHVFHRPLDDRLIPFADISRVCDLEMTKVELLVMRSLSLGLIRGSIDEVDEIVNISWVQPRILNREAIAKLNLRLKEWGEKVKGAVRLMESSVTPELVS